MAARTSLGRGDRSGGGAVGTIRARGNSGPEETHWLGCPLERATTDAARDSIEGPSSGDDQRQS